jgi:hypothetical protein
MPNRVGIMCVTTDAETREPEVAVPEIEKPI